MPAWPVSTTSMPVSGRWWPGTMIRLANRQRARPNGGEDGDAGPLEGVPVGCEGHHRHPGTRDRGRIDVVRRSRARFRRHRRGPAAGRRCSDPGQDDDSGIRLRGRVRRRCRQPRRTGPVGGRKLVGVGCGPGRRTLPGGAGQRHRRVHPGPGLVLRSERDQADVRAGAPRRRIRRVLDAGPCGPHGPNGRRPGVGARRDRGRIRRRSVRLDPTGARLRTVARVGPGNARGRGRRMDGRRLLSRQ